MHHPWSSNMNCSSYPPDPDGFTTEVDSQPVSASYGDESSYDNMIDSVVTERPNYDPHLVDTRRSSLSQDALSNQLSATEYSRRLSISEFTGQTSLDYEFMHNSDFIGDGIAQPVPRPVLDHSNNDLFGLTGPFTDDNNPPRPDDIVLEDLPEAPASQPPVINVQPPQQPTHSAMFGLPGRHTGEDLSQCIDSVNSELQMRRTQRESGLSEQHLQGSVRRLARTLNSLIEDQGPSAPNVPGLTGASAGQPKKYRCLQCLLSDDSKASFGSTGAFKRHVAEQHHPQYEFHCPVQGCQCIVARKHKIKEHITNFHRLMVPNKGHTITEPHITDQQIEADKHELPVPPTCSLCPRQVNSWPQFYDCFMRHNGRSSGPRDPASRRGSGDRGSTRGGNGLAENHSGVNGPGVGMPAAAPTDTGLGINLAQDQTSSFPGIHVDHSNPHPASFPMTPSRSDGMLGGTANPSASLEGSTQHGTPNGRGTNHGNVPRPMGPPRPGPSRSPSHQNVTPPRQRCPTCGASMQRYIRGRRPVYICEGGHTLSIRAPVWRPRGHLPQDINPQFPTRQSPLQTQIRQQTQGGTGMGNVFQQVPQFQQPQSQGSSFQPMNDFMVPPPSSPGGTQYNVSAMFDIDESGLSEVDMDHQFRETKVTQLVGSGMSCSPMGMSVGSGVMKRLKQVSKFIQDYTIMPPHISVFPRPAQGSSSSSQCNCPCRTAAILKEAYEAHAELAPGKQVKFGLKILPPEGRGTEKPQQHLRTRVQLVVKLLKLRASAAKSSRKKEKKRDKAVLEKALESAFDRVSQQPVADEADDTEASDTESIFSEDTDSMSSSFSDMTMHTPSRPTSPSPEGSCTDTQEYETTELSFDFYLESTLSAISRWSGGLSDQLCSDITSMDPSRVLEYFLRYIMYVMMALSHASDDGDGSRLH